MAENFVTFQFRFKTSSFEMRIKPPTDLSGFVEALKNELRLDEMDNIVILCPVADGRIMEIQSDEDFDFVKNNKIVYDVEDNEIYCNVVLGVRIVDDPIANLRILSNKMEKLESRVDEFLDVIEKKMEESSTVMLAAMRSLLAEIDEGLSKTKSPGQPSKLDSSNLEPKYGQHQKKTKKNKKKSSLKSTSGIKSGQP